MIVGVFDYRGRGFVRCEVAIPRLNAAGTVIFQVDTGSDHTCLNPGPGVSLDIPFDQLDRGNVRAARGVGGQSRYFVERAELSFVDDQREYESREVNLWIAEPDGRNRGLNSLLGLDVLRRWRMNFDGPNDRLQFFA